MPLKAPDGSRIIAPLTNLAALFIIIAGMRVAAPLVTQFLLVVFITIIVSPIYFKLVRWRFPPWLALSSIIASMLLAFMYGVVSLTQALTQLARDLPSYQRGFRDAVMQWSAWVAEHVTPLPDTLFEEILSARNVGIWARAMASFTGSMLGRGFVIFLIVSFLLCEVAGLPRKLRESQWMTESLWTRMKHVVVDVRHYMEIKTAISFATGLVLYIGLMMMGIDSPLLLGLLAFLLNYVPTVGSIIAGMPAVLMAYLSFGTGRAVAVTVLYLVVNQVFGSIVEPRLMGRGFGVSPVVILFSLVFWGWVLGPVGMLLSVPLTMGVRVMLGSLQDTKAGEREARTGDESAGTRAAEEAVVEGAAEEAVVEGAAEEAASVADEDLADK